MISPERSQELLHAYAATRCGAAFGELVEGWTGMVYSTALRVVRGQEALAEDVTQTVFARLAAAPGKVRNGHSLGAWLHASATGAALDAMRVEARRRRREEASHYLVMHTPEASPPDAKDGWQDLTPVIDRALSSLPARDGQLLLMRFWQQQDWRSIGRTFGVSDDAAQKRMSRALERLRRILARRGITSTTGALSAVLAGTVPRDLPAATLHKIISAAQVPAAAPLTAVVMTTKTKAVITCAIVLAAASPIFYQQQRIAVLQSEIEFLRKHATRPTLIKASAAEFAEQGDFPRGAPAASQGAPDAPSPDLSRKATTLMENGSPMDFEALNREKMKEKLAALRNRLSLTPEQEPGIARVLEYGQSKMKVLSPPNFIFQKAAPADDSLVEDAISAFLTPEQQKAYASFRAEEKANALEAVANRELSSLQSMTTLSAEQKDQVFAALSEIASREATLPVLDPDKDAAAIKEAVDTRWADRLQILGAILTPEQMAIYQKHGNPFTRGAGG